MTDPRKLRPGELCRLLNSTPLGEVIKPSQLQRHRTRAGLRIGDARHVDLIRYRPGLFRPDITRNWRRKECPLLRRIWQKQPRERPQLVAEESR